MERLTIDTGGRPYKNEDALEYLQAFDILEQWFGDLSISDCIVYGCAISGGVGNYTVTAGVLYISGKLRLFDGVAGVAFPLVLKEENIEINVREFQEGVNKATAELFKMVPDVGGAFNFDLTTTRTREEIFGANIRYKIIDTGNWDMSTATGGSAIVVAHGLIFDKIISIESVTIFIDDDAGAYPLGSDLAVTLGSVSGSYDYDGVNVNLSRVAAGPFDNAVYDKTPYNRGKIKIAYLL